MQFKRQIAEKTLLVGLGSAAWPLSLASSPYPPPTLPLPSPPWHLLGPGPEPRAWASSVGGRLAALGGQTRPRRAPRKAAGPRGAQLLARLLERAAASHVAHLAGLAPAGSTVFRTAKYTSHEVTIDEEQLQWFEELVASHPSADGWKIFVFTHAPPIGSGLRVLQAPQPSPLPPSPPP